MNRFFYFFLFLILLFIGENMFALGRHETVGVEIKVIDSITKDPLPDISIILMINKATGLFIDGDFSIISSENYRTNEDGIVELPRMRLPSLKINEMIYNIHFYINIDHIVNDLNTKHSNLTNFFIFDSRINSENRYLYPNKGYFSSKITIYPRSRERIIYMQFNDALEVRDRIDKRTYFSRMKNNEQFVIELIKREPVMSIN